MTQLQSLSSYQDCENFACERDRRKLGHNTYLERIDSGAEFGIRYHATIVVRWTRSGMCILDSGGWQTATTKIRMNEYLPAKWSIYQRKGQWFLWHRESGQEYPYADGISIDRNNVVRGAGEDSKKTAKLRKQIAKYAKDYVTALRADKVKGPNAGDCLICQCARQNPDMRDDGEHIRAHIKERYYVGSLLVCALERFGASQAMKHEVACIWGGCPEKSAFGDFVWPQVEKCLRRYCQEQLGLPS